MQAYQKARIARDARYDGKFFVAVTSTKIYCRPICPAPSPKEENVRYYDTAIAAQQAGFRPCRRCRPESAPQSAAWIGTQAVFNRAIRKIQAGDLNGVKLSDFCQTLGVSDRYLRKLFQQHLGTSPNNYANHVRLMFAKQLLHQTSLPVTDIAFISGFQSIRRFNDAFKKTLKLAPSQIRQKISTTSNGLNILLHYQAPYNWPLMHGFLQQRELSAIEKVGENFYQRTFQLGPEHNFVSGQFKAVHNQQKNAFEVNIELSDISKLMPVIAGIRKILDLDSNLELIENHLSKDLTLKPILQQGLRVPACWNSFEAGIKAILGQQVSVKAAYTHTANLIEQLATDYTNELKLFPTAEQVSQADLSFLKMPQSRKNTLQAFANWYHKSNGEDLSSILDIKGIGPWTFEYIKLRSGEDSDAFPDKDLGVLKAIKKYQLSDTQNWSPWRSYATLQLWNSLNA